MVFEVSSLLAIESEMAIPGRWPFPAHFATRPPQDCATTIQSLKSLISLSLLDSEVSSSSSDGISCRFRFLVCCWEVFLHTVSCSAASTLSQISAVLRIKWPCRAALLPDRHFCLLFKIALWSFLTLQKIVTCAARRSVVCVTFFT